MAILLGVAIYGVHRFKQFVIKKFDREIEDDKDFDDGWDNF